MGFLNWLVRRRPPTVSPGSAGTPAEPILVSRRETAAGITVSAYASGGPPKGYVSPYLSADEANALLHVDDRGLPNLRIVEFHSEWWLSETSTGRLVNAGSLALRRLGIWSVRVRGGEHAPGDLRIGPAELVREPENEFDANAVAIYQEGIRCGYWNKGAARSFAKLLDSGQVLSAYAISAHPPKVIAAEPPVIAHLVARLRP
ncbi:hypothetical protein FIV50_12850 [Microbacterium foliorum]|uniref:HIRAN domain-containing protein n=1 Tax=Microbacterium foliorum TaxID=104336 RepID=A0A4Y5YSW5_9MICO|nr:HIRAN domain-containing protein [Microbacterium foliorum]QDE35596.1 hypothetical protein FIV50_12850 [Microbacterium foliorum]